MHIAPRSTLVFRSVVVDVQGGEGLESSNLGGLRPFQVVTAENKAFEGGKSSEFPRHDAPQPQVPPPQLRRTEARTASASRKRKLKAKRQAEMARALYFDVRTRHYCSYRRYNPLHLALLTSVTLPPSTATPHQLLTFSLAAIIFPSLSQPSLFPKDFESRTSVALS